MQKKALTKFSIHLWLKLWRARDTADMYQQNKGNIQKPHSVQNEKQREKFEYKEMGALCLHTSST